METLLNALAESLRQVGFQVELHHNSFKVNGCHYACYERNNGTVLFDYGKARFRCLKRGYDVQAAIQYVILALPNKMKDLARHQEAKSYQEMAMWLKNSAQRDDVLSFYGNEDGLSVSFKVKNEGQAFTLVDFYLETVEGASNESSFEPGRPARMYRFSMRLEDESWDTVELTLRPAIEELSLTDQELDTILYLSVGRTTTLRDGKMTVRRRR
jgi:hypothetical protein